MATHFFDDSDGENNTTIRRFDVSFSSIWSMLESLKGDLLIVAYAKWSNPHAISAVMSSIQRYGMERDKIITVITCNVGDENLWKSGFHPQMNASSKGTPSLRLAGVPMLISWSDGGEKARLIQGLTDGSALQKGGEEGVSRLVSAWLSTLK
jgi:hypothetical protein